MNLKTCGYLLLAIPLLLLGGFILTKEHPSSIIIQATPIALTKPQKKEEHKKQELLDRMEQEVLMTRDPQLGFVPSGRITQAEKSRQRIGAALQRTTRYSSLGWRSRGPDNMSGRTRAVLVDRNDPTNNTVILGSVGGGLWRTTNFKAAHPDWTRLPSVSANLAISCLAQDPAHPDTMYAGTGEGYFNVDAIRGLGIYRSTDGGLTWSLLPATTTGGAQVNDLSFVQKIAVAPNGDVYASGISARFCNSGGVLKSTNAGNTWTRVIGFFNNSGSCAGAFDFFGYDLEISKDGDIWATVVDRSLADTTRGKIYYSPAGVNAGNSGTWVDVTPAPARSAYWQRIELAASQQNNGKVYAVMQGINNSLGGMFVTGNSGTTWTNISSTASWCDGGSPGGTDFSRGQAWYDLAIAVKPDDDQTVFVGAIDLMKTTNGGASWMQSTQWIGGCGALPVIHADNHDIVYLPGSAAEFIVVNDGGVYFTSDNGATYSYKGEGYNTIQYYSAAMHPEANSPVLMGGAQDNGSHILENAGLGSAFEAVGGDGGFCFIDQDDPKVMIASYVELNYYISRDSGANFDIYATYGGGRFINPTEYDNGSNCLFGSYNNGQLARISNVAGPGAISAVALSFPAATNRQVSAMKADPNTANRLWVAFSTGAGASAQVPQLYYMDQSQAPAPTLTSVTVPALPAGSYISNIDVETGNAAHLLLTVSNYGVPSVWESTNMGASWTSIEGNLPDMPVRWGIFVPGSSAAAGILLATETGVWNTTAISGTSTVWNPSMTLPSVRVDMLQFRPSDKTVVAATHGLGMYTAVLPTSLPVNLVDFSGEEQDGQGMLHWKTDGEVASEGFAVEKSGDGVHFEKIGYVPAAVQSSVMQNYAFTDPRLEEWNHYRLKMIDQDGSFRMSHTVTIRYRHPLRSVWVSNPFRNAVEIRLPELAKQVELKLVNSFGQVVAKTKYSQASGLLRWNLQGINLPRGIYFLRMERDGRTENIKLVRE
ncbi:MAG TPA: T9SS type A sorting domain-containing protein [Chitinophagaceae bacterium]|nr:T9SS type A sorting domain-containing protein [Chitinophagaceae bacterium]